MDIDNLLALDAARTPGDIGVFGEGGVLCDAKGEPFANAWGGTSRAAHAKALLIVAAVNALGPLCRRVQLLENELQAHRRYHSKVGCPGGDDCYVCALEAQLLDHGIKPKECE